MVGIILRKLSLTHNGFSLPELLVAMGLSVILASALMKFLSVMWQHSLLLRERLYVKQQGYTATRLLRRQLSTLGSGLCGVATPLWSLYPANSDRTILWLSAIDRTVSSEVRSIDSNNHRVGFSKDTAFKNDELVLLQDGHCRHIFIVRLLSKALRDFIYSDYLPLDSTSTTVSLHKNTLNSPPFMQAYRWQNYGYYASVADDDSATPVLYRFNARLARREKMLLGVESLRFFYAVDSNNDDKKLADRYLSADAVQNQFAWSLVRGIYIEFTIRGRVPIRTLNNTNYIREDFSLYAKLH